LNGSVQTWLFGTGDFRKNLEQQNVYPLNDKKKMLQIANWHLAVIYARQRINEFYQAQKNNNQALFKENIEFLKAIKDGQGEVSADTLDYERWGARRSGESLKREVDQILIVDSLQTQLAEIRRIISPREQLSFATLKQEITRLKYQELVPQVRNERTKFGQLATNAKAKAGNLEKIVDLLLETQKQAIKNNDQLIRGQLIAYQTVLESNLTKEEIQTLLTKQTELNQLEEHLVSLQINEEQAAKTLQPANLLLKK